MYNIKKKKFFMAESRYVKFPSTSITTHFCSTLGSCSTLGESTVSFKPLLNLLTSFKDSPNLRIIALYRVNHKTFVIMFMLKKIN